MYKTVFSIRTDEDKKKLEKIAADTNRRDSTFTYSFDAPLYPWENCLFVIYSASASQAYQRGYWVKKLRDLEQPTKPLLFPHLNFKVTLEECDVE